MQYIPAWHCSQLSCSSTTQMLLSTPALDMTCKPCEAHALDSFYRRSAYSTATTTSTATSLFRYAATGISTLFRHLLMINLWWQYISSCCFTGTEHPDWSLSFESRRHSYMDEASATTFISTHFQSDCINCPCSTFVIASLQLEHNDNYREVFMWSCDREFHHISVSVSYTEHGEPCLTASETKTKLQTNMRFSSTLL